jgi:predicted dienelactone hydrolase
LFAGALLSATLVASAAPADAATEYRRGPDPTAASQLEANGPFAYATQAVTDAKTPSSFGAATIYYPTDTSQGTFGAIAISPGYTEKQSAISWLGPRLASHGFVVITLDTNSIYDQPTARATALLGALDYLTGSSSVKGEIDPTRTAVMGHSMGGGGTLEAEQQRPSLKAGLSRASRRSPRPRSSSATRTTRSRRSTAMPSRSTRACPAPCRRPTRRWRGRRTTTPTRPTSRRHGSPWPG